MADDLSEKLDILIKLQAVQSARSGERSCYPRNPHDPSGVPAPWETLTHRPPI